MTYSNLIEIKIYDVENNINKFNRRIITLFNTDTPHDDFSPIPDEGWGRQLWKIYDDVGPYRNKSYRAHKIINQIIEEEYSFQPK